MKLSVSFGFCGFEVDYTPMPFLVRRSANSCAARELVVTVHSDHCRAGTSRSRFGAGALFPRGSGDYSIAAQIVGATEQIASRTGDAVGGLLNATFGNAPN